MLIPTARGEWYDSTKERGSEATVATLYTSLRLAKTCGNHLAQWRLANVLLPISAFGYSIIADGGHALAR